MLRARGEGLQWAQGCCVTPFLLQQSAAPVPGAEPAPAGASLRTVAVGSQEHAMGAQGSANGDNCSNRVSKAESLPGTRL